jgi:hypothetical protein
MYQNTCCCYHYYDNYRTFACAHVATVTVASRDMTPSLASTGNSGISPGAQEEGTRPPPSLPPFHPINIPKTSAEWPKSTRKRSISDASCRSVGEATRRPAVHTPPPFPRDPPPGGDARGLGVAYRPSPPEPPRNRFPPTS